MKIYTIEETAKQLGLHPSTVYKMVRKGNLPKVSGLGRSVRISDSVIKRLKKGVSTTKNEESNNDTENAVVSDNSPKALQVFSNSEFGELSIVIEDGKELFPATDCANILGYVNEWDAIKRHCKMTGVVKREVGVKTGTKSDGTPRIQMMQKNFITEGNLYRLIVNSKLPAAEKFERWVFEEVLPSIRRTGSYSVQKVQEAKNTMDYKEVIDEQIRKLSRVHENAVNRSEFCEISRTVAELCERANNFND